MVFYVDSQKSSSAEEIAFLLNKCILQYPGRHQSFSTNFCADFWPAGLDKTAGACYNKLLSEQTRRTRQAMPHVVCTLGLITLRPLSPKGGATKWQSTKPC